MSRSVVREAVRVLESMGLVETRRRLGVRVRPRPEWNVFDPRVIRWRLDGPDREEQLLSLGELRRGFEPVAAELAAERATPEQCGAMTGAVMQMSVHAKAGDLEAYLEADTVFHRTMLDASGNEMLAALHQRRGRGARRPDPPPPHAAPGPTRWPSGCTATWPRRSSRATAAPPSRR